MNQFFPRKLSLEERHQLRIVFEQDIASITEKSFDLWKALQTFYVSHPEEDVDEFFLFLYTNLTWRFFAYLSEDRVASAVADTVHIASIQGVDTWREIMFYLHDPVRMYEDIGTLYSHIRTAVLSSQARFPVAYKGKTYTVQEIIAEVEQQDSRSDGTLAEAEFLARIRSLYHHDADIAQDLLYSDITQGIEDFVAVVRFFLGVRAQGVVYVMRDYFRETPPPPRLPYQDLYDGYEPEDDMEEEPKIDHPSQRISQPAQPTTQETPTPDVSTAIAAVYAAYQTILQKDVAQITTTLDEYANTYHDDTIRDLIQYNEGTGTFEWNTDMLKRYISDQSV